MKVHLIQIVWHREKDAPFNAPIMSLHCHPTRNLLATAGQDKTVKVWRLVKESGKWGAQAVCELDCHERSVNCVRWSPCGTRLASCGDDKHIIVYTPREGHSWESVSSRRDVQVTTMSNNADTTDLAWSPDCVRLAVGGVDASVTIWDSGKREAMFVRKDHRSFVQGVAWDPADELLASQSSDRSLALVRVPAVFGKPDAQGRRRRRRNAATVVPQRECPLVKTVMAPLPAEAASTGEPPAPTSAASAAAPAPAPSTSTSSSSSSSSSSPAQAAASTTRPSATPAASSAPKPRPPARSLWLPESTPTFFRRPAFSPDGSLLACPTGQARFDGVPGTPGATVLTPGTAGAGTTLPVTHIFRRGNWQSPLLHLPHHGKASVATAFAPGLFCTSATPSADPAVATASAAAAGADSKLATPAPAPDATGAAASGGAPSTPAAPLFSMLLAVATMDGVAIYDTAAGRALATAAHIHMERITDISWAHDSALVAVASTDGYVSVLAMEPDEVGRLVPRSMHPKRVLDAQTTALAAGSNAPSTSGRDKAATPAATTLQPRKKAAAAPSASTAAAEPAAVNVLQPRKQAPAAAAAAEPAAVNVLQTRKKAPAAAAAAEPAAVNVLQPRKKAPAAAAAAAEPAAVNVLQPRKKSAIAPKRERNEEAAPASGERKPKRAALTAVVPAAGASDPDA